MTNEEHRAEAEEILREVRESRRDYRWESTELFMARVADWQALVLVAQVHATLAGVNQ